MFGAAMMMANATKYSIANSARFNGTSAYLQKTLTTSSTTSGSIWVKRSKLGATQPIFDNKIYFTSGDALYAFGLTSTALYRDPTAWMHIFWNGTGVYINGTLVTGTGSYAAASVTNPRLGYDGTNYFSGYMADFAFWNGTSASLQGGATDSNGVWAARRPSAGYSFLVFGSSGALGTDTSGNGNNWTTSGLASTDQMVDTPTNNYCTGNPLYYVGTAGTWAQGNLSWTSMSATSGESSGICTMPLPSSGVVYFEIKMGAAPNSDGSQFISLATSSSATRSSIQSSGGGITLANTTASNLGYYANNGSFTQVSSSFWNGATTNTVFGFLVDYTNNNVKVYQDNALWATISVTLTGLVLFPFVSGQGSFNPIFNFGQTAFAYSRTGQSVCTANLPSVAVTTSGTFAGNANADGPFVWTNGNPATLTINGNAVTFGTHADKTAGGFKLRSSSASYNTSGSNTWTATAGKRFVSTNGTPNTAQGNP